MTNQNCLKMRLFSCKLLFHEMASVCGLPVMICGGMVIRAETVPASGVRGTPSSFMVNPFGRPWPTRKIGVFPSWGIYVWTYSVISLSSVADTVG